VLVDYVCWPTGGTLQAGSDVDAALWAKISTLGDYHLADKSTAVIRRALDRAREAPQQAR